MIGSGIFLLPVSLAPLGVNAIIGWVVSDRSARCASRFRVPRQVAMAATAAGPRLCRARIRATAGFLVIWASGFPPGSPMPQSRLPPSAIWLVSSPAIRRARTCRLGAIGFVALFTASLPLGARVSGSVQIVTSADQALAAVARGHRAVASLGDEAASRPNVRAGPDHLDGIAATRRADLVRDARLRMRDRAGRQGPRSRRAPSRAPSLIGTSFVGLIYLAAASAVFLLLPADVVAKSAAPFADAGRQFLGAERGVAGGRLAIAVSAFGALNGWVLCTGEVPLAMARRGVLPAVIGTDNAGRTPVQPSLPLGALGHPLIARQLQPKAPPSCSPSWSCLSTARRWCFISSAPLAALDADPRPAGARCIDYAARHRFMRCSTFYGAGLEADLWGLVLLARGLAVRCRCAAQFRAVQPGGGGRSSRASGISRRSFCAKLRRHTSLVPSGPAI